MPPRAGTLFIVATPIGNLEDITARALRVLRDVQLIAAEDTRRTSKLLARYAIATSTTSLHEHNERTKTPTLIDRLSRGEDIALVSDAGTPLVSDPGHTLIRAAIAAGIRIEPIPGPSAVMAALAASGYRADRFQFLGFPPARGKVREEWLQQLAASFGTVVFFEAPHRIVKTLRDLSASLGDIDLFVARELTKSHEELVRGPISGVLPLLSGAKGELTIVLDVGQSPNSSGAGQAKHVDDDQIANEFGELTKNDGIARREAMRLVADRHSRSVNDVYRIVERHKKSGI